VFFGGAYVQAGPEVSIYAAKRFVEVLRNSEGGSLTRHGLRASLVMALLLTP